MTTEPTTDSLQLEAFRALSEYRAMAENLRTTQERCTRLEQENRELRAKLRPQPRVATDEERVFFVVPKTYEIVASTRAKALEEAKRRVSQKGGPSQFVVKAVDFIQLVTRSSCEATRIDPEPSNVEPGCPF